MHRFFLTTILLLGVLSSKLFAQSYQNAYNHYIQNEFFRAEGICQNLLSEELASAQRAKILKLLGLAQYMQGKRAEAAESFKLAKTLTPGLRLSNSEVLDVTVRDFYNSIEGPPPAPREYQEPKRKAPRQIEETPVQKEEPKPTTVMILSNVVDARVLVDGFFRGKVGDIIPVDPGLHNVEIYANGYQNSLQSLYMETSLLNKFTVELEKADSPETQAKKSAETKKAETAKTEDKTTKKSKKKHPPKEMTKALYFIPFGVPQYIQRKSWTGLTFTLLQAGSLGFSISSFLQSNQVADETTATINDRDATEATIGDPTQRKAWATASDDYYAEQIQSINRMRTQSYIGLGVFFLSWVGSGLEAYYHRPGYKKAPPEKIPYLDNFRHYKKEWSLNPTYISSKNSSYKGYYALNFEIRF